MSWSHTRRRTVLSGTVLAALALATACSSGGGGSTTSSSAAGASSGAPSSAASPTGTPIVIGAPVGQTGFLAASDAPLLAGAQLAVKDVNSKGGVNGHPLKLVSTDTAGVATNMVTQTNQLINQDQATVFITSFQSAAVQTQIPILQAAKIPLVAPGTLGTDQTWAISLFPTPKMQIVTQLEFAHKQYPNAKTIGLLIGQTPYGEALAVELKADAPTYGMSVSKSVEVSSTATDTTSQLQSVSGGADLLMDTLSGSIHIVEATNLSTLGSKTPIIYQDEPVICGQFAAKYANSFCTVLTPGQYPDVVNAGVKAQDDAVAKLTDPTKPTFHPTTAGWDLIQILAKTMTESKAYGGVELQQALFKATYTGGTGVFKFAPGQVYGMQGTPFTISDWTSGSEKVVYRPSDGY